MHCQQNINFMVQTLARSSLLLFLCLTYFSDKHLPPPPPPPPPLSAACTFENKINYTTPPPPRSVCLALVRVFNPVHLNLNIFVLQSCSFMVHRVLQIRYFKPFLYLARPNTTVYTTYYSQMDGICSPHKISFKYI